MFHRQDNAWLNLVSFLFNLFYYLILLVASWGSWLALVAKFPGGEMTGNRVIYTALYGDAMLVPIHVGFCIGNSTVSRGIWDEYRE